MTKTQVLKICLKALKSACEQLTLIQSDISPIDIALYLYLLSNVSLLHVVGNVTSHKSGLKRKLKVSTFRLSDQDYGFPILKFSAQVHLSIVPFLFSYKPLPINIYSY